MEPGTSSAGPFLAALSEEDADELRALGRTRRYDAGDPLFHEGDEPGGVSILLEGRVKVSTIATDREVILALRGPGDIVGEVGAIARRQRSCAVRAIEPVLALSVAADDFRRFLESHARASMNLVLMLIERLEHADEARVEFASHDVVGRVARRLVELGERFGEESGGGLDVGVALTQEELAAWTASSREAVAKALRMLRELGWIETQRRRVVIRDLASLRAYAG